jgi:hypothetical protein
VRVRFLFVTIQGFESAFYGRVGAHMRERGHQVEHLVVSTRAARRLRARGERARSLAEILATLPPAAPDEARRIAERYGLDSAADLARADPVASVRTERDAVAVVRAVEAAFEDARPDVVVPEVGRETVRLAAHAVARDRGVRTFFLFYTIFPRPLRLYVDELQGPIVPLEKVRELQPDERRSVAAFREAFLARDAPIRRHRSFAVTPKRLRRTADDLAGLVLDRGNPYLRPVQRIAASASAPLRARRARALHGTPRPGRPYVYFPLHDVEDYKIATLLPHLADQVEVVERLAAALPPGHDLVLKEHPLSIGRNSLELLRRLSAPENAILVAPRTSSNALIRGASAVAVISSTTGLEALLHRKPVLTLGKPFYAGYGVTVDADGLPGLEEGLTTALGFAPDPERIDELVHAAWNACYDGAPVLVDDSDANAVLLAQSIAAAAAALPDAKVRV